MKLHLGCGRRHLDGYLNIDAVHPKADANINVMELDLSDNIADEVLMIHFIEHLTRSDAISLFQRCLLWLKPGGRLIMEAPDRDACIRLMRDKARQPYRMGSTRSVGASGIVGGPLLKTEVECKQYESWVIDNEDHVAMCAKLFGYYPRHCIPSQWFKEPDHHKYVWGRHDITVALHILGFKEVLDLEPQTHPIAHKFGRDMRIEATK